CLPRPWLRASRRAGAGDKAVPCPWGGGSVLEPGLHGKVFFVVFEGELAGVFADDVPVAAEEEQVCRREGDDGDDEMARAGFDPRLEAERGRGDEGGGGEVFEYGEGEVRLLAA